uniref:Probable leucine-rich repeat receptor-like protein kinase At1g35710 isoform X3 n=1 Tax=Elaeis guineensis var. tenera TaxID=51953 RepID=A0A8N4F2W8_ELAGV|nr:probable leucine-rich repeat receptor-like protein kinase At1g35710 isoform X3 [Elaeis guineensis]
MGIASNLASICCFLLLLSLARCKTVKRDVKALNEIKASLGWRVVYAWVGDDPCGDGDLPPWSGVTCSQQGDYRVVTELEVYAVSIVGPFPTAVTNLLDLTRLDLHNNKLTGPIPPQIGRLKHLKILNLRWNKLRDVLPPEIGELKKLTHFDVGNNHLTGTLRDLIRNGDCFPSLRNLYLNNNHLSGGLPDQLANLINLEILYLSYNKMTGPVTPRLVHVPRLTYLYLDHNAFTGRIPDALYKHPFLKELYIEGNLFKPGAKPKGAHKVLEVTDTEFVF